MLSRKIAVTPGSHSFELTHSNFGTITIWYWIGRRRASSGSMRTLVGLHQGQPERGGSVGRGAAPRPRSPDARSPARLLRWMKIPHITRGCFARPHECIKYNIKVPMLDLHLVYSKLNSPPASCGISDIHVTYSTETSSSTVGAMFSQLESSMVTVTASAVIAAVYVQKGIFQ